MYYSALLFSGPECEDENQSSEEEGSQKSKTQRNGEALMSRVVDEVSSYI